MLYEIHRKVKVRDGYEVTATLTDGAKTRTKFFFVRGEKEPTDKSLTKKMEGFLTHFIEDNKIIPDIQMSESEVVELLILKGYLKEGDMLDDLPDNTKVIP